MGSAHGFAMFGPHRTIVTMSNTDLTYWGLAVADIATLNAATDIAGMPYAFLRLPLTAGNVVTTYGARNTCACASSPAAAP